MFIKKTAIVLALLITSLFANAGHAIYNSIGRQTIYGNSQITPVTARGFFVFDPDTKRGTAIVGLTLNHLKLFSVIQLQNYRVELLTGPKGSTYTIIAKAESPGTQFAGTLLEAVYLRGRDTAVTIDSQGTRSLPRTFFSSARAIAHNDQTGVTVGSEVTGSFTLDVNASRASNLSESHDDAVTRLTNYFIARGFTQFTPPPAN